MASKYESTLRELAMEPDEERRLEIAAEIDRDAADLDERWDNRDEYARVEAERDRIAAERDQAIIDRDELREKYTRRFFDAGEGITDRREIIDKHVDDIKMESRPMGFDALCRERDK